MSPLHVAMLIQGYFPLIGGAERQVGAVAEHLTQAGVKVSIITRRYPGLSAFEIISGVPVYRIPIPGPKISASFSYTLFTIPLLAKLKPDILHAHVIFSPATTAVIAKSLLGIPVALTAHRSGPLGDIERLKKKILGNARLAMFRRSVDLFIPISLEIDKEMELAGIPAHMRKPVPNGVDTKRFCPPSGIEHRSSIRKRLNLPTDSIIAIFTGRLAPEKRVDQLVNAWNSIRNEIPSAILLILGTGDLRDTLQSTAGEGVIFAGAIDDVSPYLQASDLFVLPSIAEGLSVAMLEAMSCGLPALVTNVGGASDVISHGTNGWLIPPDEPDTLTQSLMKLLGNETLRNKLGIAARKTVEANYSLEAVAQQLLNLYTELASSTGKTKHG